MKADTINMHENVSINFLFLNYKLTELVLFTYCERMIYYVAFRTSKMISSML